MSQKTNSNPKLRSEYIHNPAPTKLQKTT